MKIESKYILYLISKSIRFDYQNLNLKMKIKDVIFLSGALLVVLGLIKQFYGINELVIRMNEEQPECYQPYSDLG